MQSVPVRSDTVPVEVRYTGFCQAHDFSENPAKKLPPGWSNHLLVAPGDEWGLSEEDYFRVE